MTNDDLKKMCAAATYEELRQALNEQRELLAAVKERLYIIEEAITPHNLRAAALSKLARAGLTEAELKSLTAEKTDDGSTSETAETPAT